jgi:DNA-binding response OmpR family regulator
MSHKVLVFTEDRSTATSLRAGLEKRGYLVQSLSNKKRLLSLTSAGKADFVILDIPDQTDKALAICQELRESDAHVGLIVVVPGRRRQVEAQVDSCIQAPLTARKVHYRLQLLLQDISHRLLRVGDVSLDPKTRVMCRGDHMAKLTPKETLLLQMLMERAGKLVMRKDIMKRVWDTDYTGDTRTIDVHVRWLRVKLEPSPAKPVYIRTIRRQGYLFDSPDPAMPDAGTDEESNGPVDLDPPE